MLDTILIPDIHGRSFWKDALPAIKKGTPVIFLGDYHDPYPHEGISPAESLENFNEIIYYAKRCDNITLLLGNHDFTYFGDTTYCDCRKDMYNFNILKQLFKSCTFKLCSLVHTEDKPFIISHAGITKSWLYKLLNHYITYGGLPYEMYDKICKSNAIATLSVKEICMLINILLELLDNLDKRTITNLLKECSKYRGGDSESGSVIWADYSEFAEHPENALAFDQIVGHTMQSRVDYQDNSVRYEFCDAIKAHDTNVTCIDTACCYILKRNGELIPLKRYA